MANKIRLILFNYRKYYTGATERKDAAAAEKTTVEAVKTIELLLNQARSEENSRTVEYTFDFNATEEFKDGFDEAIRQVVAEKNRRNDELQALIEAEDEVSGLVPSDSEASND